MARTKEDWMNVASEPGNVDAYAVKHAPVREESPLWGKTIIFLGSSVTVGAASCRESFAEDLEQVDGIIKIKEAISGTTLVADGNRPNSYVERLPHLPRHIKADAFMCQLSTNDATTERPLGTVSDSYDMETFDTKTIAGAMEYIIAYARETWGCPVTFYTGTKYESEHYQKMVDLLKQLCEKWEITFLNLWDDEEMMNIDQETYDLYMFDPIHPTRAGYLKWWFPKFEEFFENLFEENETNNTEMSVK